MFNHAPAGYGCPFCVIVAGRDEPPSATLQADVVYRDELITAFIACDWWSNNPGHVLVIPNQHFENIYDLPFEEGARIQAVVREIAVAMKLSYGCDGTSTRQHNEPAGNQDVWHYHIHVFPRYANDFLYLSKKRRTVPEERVSYAAKLRRRLATVTIPDGRAGQVGS